MLWDLFCRVIDNHGDIGVCWRLAADLAARGERVRLWVDDPSALAWMAPRGAAGVAVAAWNDATAWPAPGDVVVEAFGCDPPAAFVDAMARRAPAPRWINLEYLSAEPYVERSHGLPSPQRSGLVKRFFYPGFTPRTGGLIREPGLLAARAAFDRDAWLGAHGWAPAPGERVVVLFCYANPALPALLDELATRPTLLLVAAGRAAPAPRPGLRVVALPWLTQADFDPLLWSADLAFVRGEDSFVRAMWAGVPFVWQAYPQDDRAHAAKVEAFLDLQQAPTAQRSLWRGWNGLAPLPAAAQWPQTGHWSAQARAWRDRLAAQCDLVTQLRDAVSEAG